MAPSARSTRPFGTTGWLNRLFMLVALAAFALLAFVGLSPRKTSLEPGGEDEPSVGMPSPGRSGDAPAPPVSIRGATADALFGGRVVIVAFSPERFVELADGTRLLPGARLAHGYRLAGIERGGVVLERDGVESTLALP